MGFKKWLESRRAAKEAEKLRRTNPYAVFGLSLEQAQKIQELMDEFRREHAVSVPVSKPEPPPTIAHKIRPETARRDKTCRHQTSDDDSCSLIDTIVTIEILESIF